jgi:hypothetical protein
MLALRLVTSKRLPSGGRSTSSTFEERPRGARSCTVRFVNAGSRVKGVRSELEGRDGRTLRFHLRSGPTGWGLVRTDHHSGGSLHFVDGVAVNRPTTAPAAIVQHHDLATVREHRVVTD